MIEKIKLPDSWEEVSIGKYQEISSIETTDNTKRWIEVIAILANEDPEKIKKVDPVIFSKLILHLNWITILPQDKIFKEELNINGVTYKFKERLQDLSIGEWIDLEAYIEETNHNLHKTFAVLYSDGSENLENRAELFKEHLMIGDVYAALVFFSLIAKESITTIKDFLALEMQTQKETRKMIVNN